MLEDLDVHISYSVEMDEFRLLSLSKYGVMLVTRKIVVGHGMLLIVKAVL
jgi:hypothetical protein